MRSFGYLVIAFNFIAVAIGFCMPWLIAFQAHAKFADFNIPELTQSYIDETIHLRLPDIVGSVALSLVGIWLGAGIAKGKDAARKGWLCLCFLWVIILAITWLFNPDSEMRGLGSLVLRLGVLVISCRVLLSASAREQFQRSTP